MRCNPSYIRIGPAPRAYKSEHKTERQPRHGTIQMLEVNNLQRLFTFTIIAEIRARSNKISAGNNEKVSCDNEKKSGGGSC